MNITREDFDGYYILRGVDDSGRTRLRLDGTLRYADSRECENPELEVRRGPHAQIRYSSKGIV